MEVKRTCRAMMLVAMLAVGGDPGVIVGSQGYPIMGNQVTGNR